MKQPKKLTRSQKVYLEKKGLNPNDYMFHSETDANIILWKKSERVQVGIAKKSSGRK